MTTKNIHTTQKRIAAALREGYTLEALLSRHHLNIDLLKRVIRWNDDPGKVAGFRDLARAFRKQQKKISGNDEMTLSGTDLTAVNSWLKNSRKFFRTLRVHRPADASDLLQESARITGILNSVLKSKSGKIPSQSKRAI